VGSPKVTSFVDVTLRDLIGVESAGERYVALRRGRRYEAVWAWSARDCDGARSTHRARAWLNPGVLGELEIAATGTGARCLANGEGRPKIPGLLLRSGTEARRDGVSEYDPDTGSSVWTVLGDDRAAMGTNDRRNDCQSETGAAVVSGPAGV
jgi:hypothetical protein